MVLSYEKQNLMTCLHHEYFNIRYISRNNPQNYFSLILLHKNCPSTMPHSYTNKIKFNAQLSLYVYYLFFFFWMNSELMFLLYFASHSKNNFCLFPRSISTTFTREDVIKSRQLTKNKDETLLHIHTYIHTLGT